MATPQKITRDNYAPLLLRSTNPRGSTPNGNVYFDTANDKIQLITADELANVTYPVGHAGYVAGAPEANPLTSELKVQALALYFFALQEVEADPTLQGFRTVLDAVGNRMGKLVGATGFLNAVTLDTNTTTQNLKDHDKVCDSGFTEFAVNGDINKVFHGVKSLNPINATTQGYYLLAASLSEAHRQAATPVDFSNPGSINDVIQTYQNGGTDNRNSLLIVCAREFGYTIGEANSTGTGVAELGAYSQGYGVGNAIAADVAALSYADVWTTPVAPFSNLTFYRHATPQARSGFSTAGGGASGNFTDEIQLASGTMSIVQLRAWLDALMLQDTDENANTGATGSFKPKRAEPLYTIDGATSKLVTRKGIYVAPAKLTAAAQQQIVETDDAGGLHYIPFNSGVVGTLSQAWLDDAAPWFRGVYKDAAAGKDFDTANAKTVKDASGVDIAGTDLDARISGTILTIAYAYDTETAGGDVTAGVDQVVVMLLGGIDKSKTRTVEFTITRSASISVDLRTELETN